MEKSIKVAGEVGAVYTTPTGNEEANPNLHEFGWWQKEEGLRVWVSSVRAPGVHSRDDVWVEVS